MRGALRSVFGVSEHCCNTICVIVALCLIMLPIWDLRRCSDTFSTNWNTDARAHHKISTYLSICAYFSCLVCCIHVLSWCQTLRILLSTKNSPTPPPLPRQHPPFSLHSPPLPSSPSNHLCFYYDRSTVSFIRCFSLHLLPYPPPPPLLLLFVRTRLCVDLSDCRLRMNKNISDNKR